MIVFDLKCSKNHVFEAWFKSSAAWEDQRSNGKVICPVCGDQHIEKAIMAPAVSTVQNHRQSNISTRPLSDRQQEIAVEQQQEHQAATGEAVEQAIQKMEPEQVKALMTETYKAIRNIQKSVEENADNVGAQFAEEARSMHYGETEQRPIYGETTDQESDELEEEGIEFTRLPWLPQEDA